MTLTAATGSTFLATCARYKWCCHAYCLMDNHFHIVIETPEANLSKGMRQLNGLYTQKHNAIHSRVGHVFQGRFKAILVQRESYLLELARYVVLNPVRAGLCPSAGDWPWSSHRAMMGQAPTPPWLPADWLLAQFGGTRAESRAAYAEHVQAGTGQPSVWQQLQGQVILGDAAFVQAVQERLNALDGLPNASPATISVEISRAQRLALTPPLPLAHFVGLTDRNLAIAQAFASGAHTQQQIAQAFGLHYVSVSRIVRKQEGLQREVTAKSGQGNLDC